MNRSFNSMAPPGLHWSINESDRYSSLDQNESSTNVPINQTVQEGDWGINNLRGLLDEKNDELILKTNWSTIEKDISSLTEKPVVKKGLKRNFKEFKPSSTKISEASWHSSS